MQRTEFHHPVLDYFWEISQIPRGSGNEQAISDWLVSFAHAHRLDVLRDAANNVLIRKPASSGYEDAPTVLLQGHMDMVCEKNPGVVHDFLRDPIEIIVEGDYVRANGTTLGADNGIGMSYMLAVLADDTLAHPALECLFTTEEEVGMLGLKALDYDLFGFKAGTMINLDAGGEGVFIAGCAGGGRITLRAPIEWIEPGSLPAWRIFIGGLLGGHSGAEIHLGRASAIQVLGRVLQDLKEDVSLCEIHGGTRENAISREAEMTVACAREAVLMEKCRRWQEILRGEYRVSDPDITVQVEYAGTVRRIYGEGTFRTVCDLLSLLPQGVVAMDMELGRVFTSANLGVITSDEKEISFISSVRSSGSSHMDTLLIPRYEALARLSGAGIEKRDFYEGWEYRPDSRVGAAALACYREFGSVEPVCTIIHGGLECGLLIGALGDLDTIAFAPEINGCHSPSENMKISSVKVYYEVLKALLSRLNETGHVTKE